MIIKQTPVLRRDWPAGTTGTDKSEGKFAKLSADGKTMSLVTSATDIPDGVVSNPDGRDGADGNGGDPDPPVPSGHRPGAPQRDARHD